LDRLGAVGTDLHCDVRGLLSREQPHQRRALAHARLDLVQRGVAVDGEAPRVLLVLAFRAPT
jgi:hypothetical protein